MLNLISTYGNFTLKGKIVNLHNQDSLSAGHSKITEWKRLEFGVQIDTYSVIYVSLFGFKSEEIKFFNRKKRLDNQDENVVQWNKRLEIDLKTYRFMNEVEINIDPHLRQENEILISWDAIEYILENVPEQSNVLINGRLEIEEYNGKVQRKLILKNLFLLDEIVSESEFGVWYSQDIIFNYFEKEKELVHAFIVNKKRSEYEIIPLFFKIYKKNVLHFFENCDIVGRVMKVHGSILQKIEVEDIDGELCLSGNFIDELIIDGGKLDKDEKLCYNIEELVEMRQKIKDKKNEEKLEELGFNVDDDVNEHGF